MRTLDNNLRNIEKTLRNFVKRCKGVTYTKEMLFTFLLTGSFAQAAVTQAVQHDYPARSGGLVAQIHLCRAREGAHVL